VITFTQAGKEEKPFVANVEAQLARQEGKGYLDHMWFVVTSRISKLSGYGCMQMPLLESDDL
jgi:hypothetical protein